MVFEKLTDLGLTLNVKECKFFQKYVEYVGFILSENGIQTNPEKVDAVIAAPEPTNVTELQSFLGAVNYYGKFINGVSTMASSLYELLKKDVPWSWGRPEAEAFSSVKGKLTTATITVYL